MERQVVEGHEISSLGELISLLYEKFLAVYKDEELASVAVAATINDLLQEDDRKRLESLSREN